MLEIQQRSFVLALSLATCTAACSSGSDSGGTAAGANQAMPITFDLDVALGSVGVPIAPIAPQTNGSPSSYSIAPPLPPGLALDPVDGTISGTPTTAFPRTVHTLTAHFGAAQTTTTIELEVVRTGRYLFVGAAGPSGVDGALARVTVDAARGEVALSKIVPTGPSDEDPHELELHPSGRFVYAAHPTGDALSIRTLDELSGDLGAATLEPFAPGSQPRSIAVDPTGAWLFALLRGASRIEVFAIDAATGALTLQPTAGAATGAGGETLAFDPSGAFLFCANEADGTVAAYALDPPTGTLVETGPRVTTGPFPRGLAAIDAGFLYVSAPTLSAIAILAFDDTGALSLVDTHQLGGPVPTRLAAHPNGRLLALIDQTGAQLATYAIDRTTGALAATGPAVATPAFPRALSFDPSGAWLAVTGQGDAEMTLFAVDRKTGAATEAGRVATPAGPFDALWTLGDGPLIRYADLAFTSDATTGAIATFEVDEATGDLAFEPGPPFAGPAPSGLASDPDGRFVYAPDAQAGTVAMFRVASGAPWLTALGASPTGQSGLAALAVDPTGRFVAAASPAGDGVTSFVIDQGRSAFVEGDLIPASVPFLATGTRPVALAYGRLGSFLFVAHEGSGPGSRAIDVFLVDPQTGSLAAPASALPTPINGLPTDLGVHPNGLVLYAAITSVTGGNVAAWALDPLDGSRTQIAPAQPAGELGRGLAVDPRGRFLACATGSTTGPGAVAMLPLDPTTGGLGAATLHSAGLQPVALAFDPSGDRLYVVGQGGDVTRCDVDPADGALSVTGSFPAGVSTNGIVLRERRR